MLTFLIVRNQPRDWVDTSSTHVDFLTKCATKKLDELDLTGQVEIQTLERKDIESKAQRRSFAEDLAKTPTAIWLDGCLATKNFQTKSTCSNFPWH